MIQAIQLIFALSLLVVIHELGHFAFARMFNVRVEKFYMFFNPGRSLIRAKRINGHWQVRFLAPNVEPATTECLDATGHVKTDEKGKPIMRPMTEQELQLLDENDWRRYPDNTEWGIGWVPFGGYCAIAGMVDETKSATDLPSEPQPWEFRSRNVWQRFGIIVGGILVNFVAALMLLGLIMFHWGTDTLPLSNVNTGLYYSKVLLQEGFEQQDKIISIDGVEPQTLTDVIQWLIIEGKQQVVVNRGGEELTLQMSDDLGIRYLAIQNEFDRQERQKKHKDPSYTPARYILLSEFVPFIIDSVMPSSAADFGGLKRGDNIVSVGGVQTPCDILAIEELRRYPCDSVAISYLRHGEMYSADVFLGDQCKLGVIARNKYDYFTIEHRDYTILEAIPAGIAVGWDMLLQYIKQFRLVFSKEGAQSLGGFGAIGSMFPKMWDWHSFWFMTAWLSLILAFMNFLPIPALDGGYILFLLVEMVTRKQPSDKFLEYANQVGFYLLLALLIFANGNDIFKSFF